MNVLPRRVRKVMADRFPLACHLVVDLGAMQDANVPMSFPFALFRRRTA